MSKIGSSSMYGSTINIYNTNVSADKLEGKEIAPSSMIISAEQDDNGEDTGFFAILMTDESKIATTIFKNYVIDSDGNKVLLDEAYRQLISR